MRRGLLFALLLLPTLSLSAPAQERELYWDEVLVAARLDGAGVLHLSETQTFVFTGDWNGGERGFVVDLGEDLDFHRLMRVEPGGREVELAKGDLDEIDRYDWSDKVLRWRSRLPSDPPFQDTRKIYRLEYSMRGVLRPTADGTYKLTYDFLFPTRSGPVRRFVLDFAVDPSWQVLGPLPAHIEQRDLPPGESFVLPLEIAWRGEGTPAAVPQPPARETTVAFWAVALLGVFPALLFHLLRRERKLGRFARLPVSDTWDARLLRKELLSFRPEEVGALWDRRVGPPEVAAVLARLTAEGKLESRVLPKQGFLGRQDLALALKQPLETFEGYERALLEKLFFGGRTEVDTRQIRAHYKDRGLDPAGLIRAEIERRLAERADLDRSPAPARWGPAALLLAALAGFARDLFAFRMVALPPVLAAVVVGALLYAVAAVAAGLWRKRVERLELGAGWFLAPSLLFVLFGLALALLSPPGSPSYPGVGTSLALPLLVVAFLWSVTHWAMSREGVRAIAQRKRLAGIRRMLRAELQRREPRLEDAWFPYLLAFGLERDVDRWFDSFGGTAAGGSLGSIGSTSSSSSGGGGGWSGGGGAFGGAGATAGWSVAAAGLAAGVASSSSSSGGGGGGGSSGGGSGGGW